MGTIRFTWLPAIVLALAATAIACDDDDDDDILDADLVDTGPAIDAEPDEDAADLDGDVEPDAAAVVTEVACDDVTPNVEIEMENIAFVDPDGDDQTGIATGDIVQWTNTDEVDHTVTSGSPDDDEADQGALFDSGLIAQDESFCLQFNEADTFEYFCRTHPQQMRDATITVADN